MKFSFDDNEVNLIQFCDYIEIETKDDVYIFNLVCTKDNKLYLQYENESLIKELTLLNSKILIFYVNGDIKEINEIKNIYIDDHRFRRKYFLNIEGTFLKYTEDMAVKYNLDKELAFATLSHTYIRKKNR